MPDARITPKGGPVGVVIVPLCVGTVGTPGVDDTDGIPGVDDTVGTPGVDDTDGIPGVGDTVGTPGVCDTVPIFILELVVLGSSTELVGIDGTTEDILLSASMKLILLDVLYLL